MSENSEMVAINNSQRWLIYQQFVSRLLSKQDYKVLFT